jgi:peptide/nickel transport system permease protein
MTAFALALGGIIGGGILVDIVFSYPGLGFVLYDGILNEDYPLIQAVFLFIIIGVLLANFFMDILYVKLDPRIAEGE